MYATRGKRKKERKSEVKAIWGVQAFKKSREEEKKKGLSFPDYDFVASFFF